eukprot:2253614-Prymnesium_polylepis.2
MGLHLAARVIATVAKVKLVVADERAARYEARCQHPLQCLPRRDVEIAINLDVEGWAHSRRGGERGRERLVVETPYELYA